MKKHYQQIIDEVLGHMSKYRTLRTLFDPGSYEYSQTTMEKKREILAKLLNSSQITIEEIESGYKNFYRNELANKAYVADSFEEGLKLINDPEII